MNVKRILGLLGIVLGILLIWFSVHAKGKVMSAKAGMNEVSSFFPNDKVSSSVESRVHSKLSRYEMMIRWSMIGGVVLIAAGAFVAIRARKR